MYSKVIVISLAFFLSSAVLNAQFRCGFDKAIEKLSLTDPGYKRNIAEMNSSLRLYIENHKDIVAGVDRTQAAVYTIPCVVHVIHTGGAIGTNYNPSAAQITGAINYVNSVYDGSWTDAQGPTLGAGDLQIKFVLATKDPNNSATSGIDRVDGSGIANYSANGANASNTTGADELTVKNLTRWDPYKYYNIWVVNKIDGCDGYSGCPSFIAGYAYFPISSYSSAAARDLDGTIMLASQMIAGQKTLPHEIGHAFNLYHPFEGDGEPGANNCPANGSPTMDGDQCADTDPITNPALAPNAPTFACRTGNNSCTSTPFTDNTEKNYMNYTNCYRLFTSDQKVRMLASVVNTMRASLATSWANNTGTYPTTWIAPLAPAVVPGSLNTNPDIAGILSIELNGKKVYSLDATQDGGYVNRADKWYELFQLQKNTSYTMNIGTIGFTNKDQVGVWIDYDGNGIFNNTNEKVFYQDNIAGSTTNVVATFTTPSSLPGTIVRMRVIEDLYSGYGPRAQFNGTTANLTWGQAEDYPVFLQASPLPVTLIDFTGQKIARAINLEWKIAQEINAKEYQVERSSNGRDFNTIGIVTAKGSADAYTYHFTDNNINTGTYFYKLKMVDKDDVFSYSKIINFNSSSVVGLQVVGNPFKDDIRIILPDHTGMVSFRLTDAAGRLLFSKKSFQNNNTVQLNFTDQKLGSGIYILETMMDGERFINKLVKE